MKVIYCIKNDKNEIIYVGQTVNLQRRKYEHRYRKHIPKTYNFEILENCEDNLASKRESYYIKLYNLTNNGLNKIIKNVENGIKTRFAKGNTIWKLRKTKKVKCLENGIIYNSAKECAISLGINNYSKINNVCNGNRKSFHKYHFEYVD